MAERLIDAKVFEKQIEKEIIRLNTNAHKHFCSTGKKDHITSTVAGAFVIVKDWLNMQPTIETKPVVYCKDCKYNVANSKHDPLDITDYTDITCEYFMTDGMSPNDYCSQGVKIPVISMEDVPKMIEKELPSVEESPILKAIREVRARREAEESDKY